MMKWFLLLALSAPASSFALGDLERGVLMYGNSASGGSLLPHMEGELARIRLEGIRRQQAFAIAMDQQRAADYRESRIKRLADIKASEGPLEESLAVIQQNLDRMRDFRATLNTLGPMLSAVVMDREEIAKRETLLRKMSGSCQAAEGLCPDVPPERWGHEDVEALMTSLFERRDQWLRLQSDYQTVLDANRADAEVINNELNNAK